MQNEKFNETVATLSCEETLRNAMLRNVAEAEEIYKAAIEGGFQHEQFFMDWQDKLNRVTFVHEEDLA